MKTWTAHLVITLVTTIIMITKWAAGLKYGKESLEDNPRSAQTLKIFNNKRSSGRHPAFPAQELLVGPIFDLYEECKRTSPENNNDIYNALFNYNVNLEMLPCLLGMN